MTSAASSLVCICLLRPQFHSRAMSVPCCYGHIVLFSCIPKWLIVIALIAWDSRFPAACCHAQPSTPARISCLSKCYGRRVVAIVLAPALMHKDHCRPNVRDYEPVFDLRGQSDIEVAKELTGRSYTPTNYWLDVVPDTATRGLQVCASSCCAL